MSQNRKDGVTDADILKTLKDSGYPLEQEIASILEKMGWDCTLNYAFTDVETNVSRETDILAQRDMTLERYLKNLTESAPRIGDAESKSRWRSMNERVRLHVEVIVECKKVTSPVVFFCRNKQPKDLFPMYADDMVQYSGVKSEITVKPWNELSTHTFTLGQFLEFGKICHYAKCKEKATQFCKVFRTGAKFKADHAEIYQSFILPLIKAVEYQKLVRKLKSMWMYFDMHLHYPLIVIEGEMLRVNSECTALEKVNHVELVRNYYSGKIGGTYRIDVVSKDYFPEFIEKVLMPSVLSIESEVRKKEKAIAKGTIRVRTAGEFYHSIL